MQSPPPATSSHFPERHMEALRSWMTGPVDRKGPRRNWASLVDTIQLRGFWKTQQRELKLIILSKGGPTGTLRLWVLYSHTQALGQGLLGCMFPMGFEMKLVFFSLKMYSLAPTHPSSRNCTLCLGNLSLGFHLSS